MHGLFGDPHAAKSIHTMRINYCSTDTRWAMGKVEKLKMELHFEINQRQIVGTLRDGMLLLILMIG